MGDLVRNRRGEQREDEEAFDKIKVNTKKILDSIDSRDISNEEAESLNRQILSLFKLAGSMKDEELSQNANKIISNAENVISKRVGKPKAKRKAGKAKAMKAALPRTTRPMIQDKPVSNSPLTIDQDTKVNNQRRETEVWRSAEFSIMREKAAEKLREFDKVMEENDAPPSWVMQAASQNNRFFTNVSKIMNEVHYSVGTLLQGNGFSTKVLDTLVARLNNAVENYIDEIEKATDLAKDGKITIAHNELGVETARLSGQVLSVGAQLAERLDSIPFTSKADFELRKSEGYTGLEAIA